MATKVIMPQGGQDLDKGVVLSWWKKEGDDVKKGETLCEIETEKAVFEVPAPANGVLRKILFGEGSEVPVFTVIAVIGGPDEPLDLDQLLAEEKTGPAADQKATAPVLTVQTPSPAGRGAKIEITPKAKRLAMDKGIPIQSIKGSGPGGRITEADVLAAIESGLTQAQPAGEKVEEGRKVTLTKQRKVIARKMLQSKQTVPHFYVTVTVDMSQVVKMRTAMTDQSAGKTEAIPSVTDFITRACALTIKEFPEINSSYVDEDTLVYWETINLGIAIALPEGLVVEVIEGADRLSLEEIAKYTRRLVATAQEGKQFTLAPSHFTISNLGMYQIDSFAAIINPPESAILAVGSIQKQAVPAENGQIEIKERMTLTLSLDHRVGDGVLAARFLNKVRSLLEEPQGLI